MCIRVICLPIGVQPHWFMTSIKQTKIFQVIQSKAEMDSTQIDTRRYVLTYVAYYMLCAVLLVAVLAISGMQLSYSLELSMVLASSLGLSSRFVKENSRAPSLQERRKLSLACMFASMVLSVLLSSVAILFFSGPGQVGENLSAFFALPAFIWFAAFVFSMGINYLTLNLALGWFARKTEANLRAKP